MKIWSELRRRNVLRMGALYAIAAWLIVQVVDVLSGLVELPDWIGPLVVAMLAVGFPIALALAWFFEITDSGIARDEGPGITGADRGLAGRRLDFIIIAMLAAALVVFATLTWRKVRRSTSRSRSWPSTT